MAMYSGHVFFWLLALGFVLETSGCGGSYSSMSGAFTSPLYPSNYNKHLSCTWIISAPGLVSLTVEDLETESQEDWLEVFNRDGVSMSRVSGAMTFYVLISDSYYRIIFTSNQLHEFRGFKVTWKEAPSTLPRYLPCPSTLQFTEGLTTGMNFRCLEHFNTTLRSECSEQCVYQTTCDVFYFVGQNCLLYEFGSGGTPWFTTMWFKQIN